MQNIYSINQKLKSINKKLYIAGGFCRDYFIAEQQAANNLVAYDCNRTLQENVENFYNNYIDGDIDLVTDATPDEMKVVLKVVGEVGKKYGTCIVSSNIGHTQGTAPTSFEMTTFRKDIGTINNRKPAEVEFTLSLEEDSKRRDMRCNAIYYDVENSIFIDPQLGIEDIQNNVIQFVGNAEERIQEDALRILRFVRFKNKYCFDVKDFVGGAGLRPVLTVFHVLRKHSHLLKNISAERIKQELDKILLLSISPFAKGSPQMGRNYKNVQALQDLKDIDFFKHIIPELDVLDRCLGNKYHQEGDVWIHTKMCVVEMNIVINREKIVSERALILLWSILLHDIGKAPTYTVGEDGEGHYYDHERIGAEMFSSGLSSRLKFSTKQSKIIKFIIKEHLRVFLIPQMKKLKSRKLMMEKHFDDLLLVGEADNNGRIPRKEETFRNICEIVLEFRKIIKTKKFLSGEDIIEKYPHLKGGQIGERMEQLNNEILIKDN